MFLEFLKNSFGKRIVPESEIAQSIAYSSTEKYCNTMSESSAVTSHNNSDFGIVLVEETPDLVKVNDQLFFFSSYFH